jgi:hypothetical protein
MTNAAGAGWPETARAAMPSITVTSHAVTPVGTRASGFRQPRDTTQPTASAVRNGHAVDAMPPTASPLAWLARPISTNSSTQQASIAAPAHWERISSA